MNGIFTCGTRASELISGTSNLLWIDRYIGGSQHSKSKVSFFFKAADDVCEYQRSEKL